MLTNIHCALTQRSVLLGEGEERQWNYTGTKSQKQYGSRNNLQEVQLVYLKVQYNCYETICCSSFEAANSFLHISAYYLTKRTCPYLWLQP